MASPNTFIVSKGFGLPDGSVACKPPEAGLVVLWRPVLRDGPPPADILTWETQTGAQKFADMNGGTVTTVLEFFYSPRQPDPVVN